MSKKEDLEKRGYKTYENDDIRVFWNPEVCEHAAECVMGNINVFVPAAAPG